MVLARCCGVHALKKSVQTLCSHSKKDVGVFRGTEKEEEKRAFSETTGIGGKECIPKVEHHVMTVSEEKL